MGVRLRRMTPKVLNGASASAHRGLGELPREQRVHTCLPALTPSDEPCNAPPFRCYSQVGYPESKGSSVILH
jgi:hypothetical protein